MPIEIGNLQDIINNISADIRTGLPALDPSIQGSIIKVITESLGARAFDNRQLIAQLIQQAFPQTSTDEFLELWAEYDGLTRNPATPSSGFITITGSIIGTEVPVASVLNSLSNVILNTQTTVTIANIVTSITSLTFSAGVVTATCAADHNLASGVLADILGANEDGYNGTFPVTALSNLIFTYIPDEDPTVTPATGTLLVDFDGAVVEVVSQGTGIDQNIGSGSVATFSSPITGVDTSAFVRPDGIEGGTDIESDEDLRVRVLENRATIQSLFNSDFLVQLAKTVSGVTRVFVKEITLVTTEVIGATTVYFMRDGDDNPIPSGIDITNVNDVLQAIRPANMIESDFLILAPTAVPVPITLSSIVPDTPTMRTNIKEVLEEFFSFQVDFESDVLVDRIKSALFNAQDTETGDFLETFTLDAPAADVTIALGEIGTLGTVTIN